MRAGAGYLPVYAEKAGFRPLIHPITARLLFLHKRLGDARLLRFLDRFSVGQGLEALAELTGLWNGMVGSAWEDLTEELQGRGFGLITPLDAEYPSCFRAMGADAPPFLYVQGDVARLSAKSIAIIGTRKPTAAGRAAADAVARAAVEEGWLVVSGNAPGVDCAGHTAALSDPAAAPESSGATLVFPPVPPEQYQPIFKNSDPHRVTVASPFVPGTTVAPWMFLRRNSLVAAQCRAAFVAETGVRGGTLDTVKKLRQLRRPTFATLLPADARFQAAHRMLAAGGGVELLDILSDAGAANTILEAAAAPQPLPALVTAVLNDFFGEDASQI